MEEALLRACQAVDRQRKKVLYMYEERRQRIKSLVDSFNALRESEADAEQLEKPVSYTHLDVYKRQVPIFYRSGRC